MAEKKKPGSLLGRSTLWLLALAAAWATWSQYIGGGGGWLGSGTGAGREGDASAKGAPIDDRSARPARFGGKGLRFLRDPEARALVLVRVQTRSGDALPHRRVSLRRERDERTAAFAIAATAADGVAQIAISRTFEPDLRSGGLVAFLDEDAAIPAEAKVPAPQVSANETRVTLVAEPRPVVDLDLRDADGRPFDGEVLIEARDAASGSGESRPAWSELLVTTAKNGLAAVGGLLPGRRLELRVEPRGHPPSTATIDVPRTADSRRTAPVTVLPGIAHVIGRLLFTDGSAASDREITLSVFRRIDDPKVAGTSRTRTARDGSFDFTVESGADLLMEVRATAAQSGEDAAPFVFESRRLDAGATWDLGSLKLEREIVLVSGTLALPDGGDPSAATVLAIPLDPNAGARRVRPDPQGHFELRVPASMGACELFALTENGAWRSPEPVRPGGAAVTVQVAQAGSVHGFLARPPAEPVHVELRIPAGPRYASTRVQPDGTFAFPHVPPGTWRVVLLASGAEAPVGNVVVEGGKPCADSRLAGLTPPSSGATSGGAESR